MNNLGRKDVRRVQEKLLGLGLRLGMIRTRSGRTIRGQ
jgi:hypothetical protein